MSTGPPAPECLRSVLQKAAMKRKPDSEGRQSPLCDVEGISTMIVVTCQYLFGFFSNTGSNDTPFDINSNQSFIILKFQSIWRWLSFLQKKITHIQGAFLVQDKSKLAFPFSCVIQAWRPFSTLRLTWYVQAEWSPAHTPLLVLRYDRSLYKILLITLPETKTFYLRHNLPSFTTTILACLHLRLPKEWTMETGDKWGKRGAYQMRKHFLQPASNRCTANDASQLHFSGWKRWLCSLCKGGKNWKLWWPIQRSYLLHKHIWMQSHVSKHHKSYNWGWVVLSPQ